MTEGTMLDPTPAQRAVLFGLYDRSDLPAIADSVADKFSRMEVADASKQLLAWGWAKLTFKGVRITQRGQHGARAIKIEDGEL